MDEHDELEPPTSTSDSEMQPSSSQVGLAASRQTSRAGVRTSDATPPNPPEQTEPVGSDDTASEIGFGTPATDAFDRLTDQPNVLFVGPAASAVACGRSIRQSMTESTATNQLLMCIETPFDAQLDILRTSRTEVTEQRVVITAPPHARTRAIEMSERQVDVLNVERPTDLPRLGTEVTNLLTQWTDA
ncbi:hypothetical protein, partial [Halorubrum sp. Atlit-28R]|uniref:hypothetical protein n=1 Tax=Halorubrum sp. Atlit-28R TaxID=2282129 RepID=UPI000EF29530